MANSGYVASSLFFGFQEICYRECIIVLTTFLFVRLLVSRGVFKKSTPPSNPPPPSPTGLPFFGNLFSFQEDMRHLFRKWTNEIGGIFRLRIGPVMDIVVINDAEAVREAFVEKADAFSDRMVPPLLGEALGKRESETKLPNAFKEKIEFWEEVNTHLCGRTSDKECSLKSMALQMP